MHLKAARLAPDGLSTEEWSFYDLSAGRQGLTIVLGSYVKASRSSKRHKFTRDGHYERTNRRDSTITLDAVPLPEDVVEEVRQHLIAGIHIGKDSPSDP